MTAPEHGDDVTATPTRDAGAGLKAEIESQIFTGTWPPGFRLPGERALAAQYGVSRAVVREVLQTIAAQGNLDISPARGAYVRRPDGSVLAGALTQVMHSHRATVRDVGSARALLEREVAGLAAAKRGGGLEAELAKLAHRIDTGQDRVDQAVADLRFHALMCRAAGNPVLTAMYRAIAPYVLFMTLRRNREHEPGGALHTQIIDAVRAGDVAAAQALSTAHLDVTERFFGDDFDRPVTQVAAENLERIANPLRTLDDVERLAFAALDNLLTDSEKEK